MNTTVLDNSILTEKDVIVEKSIENIKTYQYKNLTVNMIREYAGAKTLEESLYNLILRDTKHYEITNCA